MTSTPKLRGGPLDGIDLPEHVTDDVYEAQHDLNGTWSMVRYERNDDGEYEYAGSKSIADIATEAVAEPAADEPVDIEKMPVADALAFLREDNERRIQFFKDEAEGNVDLSQTWDLQFCRIFINRILLFMSPKIHTEASLEYENLRSHKLDEIEDQYTEFQDQRDKAVAQAKLGINQPPGPPGGIPQPTHMGRVTIPPRRVRRGG